MEKAINMYEKVKVFYSIGETVRIDEYLDVRDVQQGPGYIMLVQAEEEKLLHTIIPLGFATTAVKMYRKRELEG